MPAKVSQPEEREDLQSSTSASRKYLRIRTIITKLIKTERLDQDILHLLEEGLITVEEVQASIAQYVIRPTAIAGVYVESSKTKMSFLEAAEKGLLAKTYAIEYLMAQAATGGIIDPVTGDTYPVLDALEAGLLDEEDLIEKLMKSEKAVTGYVHGNKTLSVFQAMEERILDRHFARQILEA